MHACQSCGVNIAILLRATARAVDFCEHDRFSKVMQHVSSKRQKHIFACALLQASLKIEEIDQGPKGGASCLPLLIHKVHQYFDMAGGEGQAMSVELLVDSYFTSDFAL